MFQSVLTKVFGSKHERDAKKLQSFVDEINSLEPSLKNLSDDRLKARTEEFKKRLASGETLDDLTNLTLPLTVSGPADSPKVGVELGGLAKSLATEKVREKVTEKLFDKLGVPQTEEEEAGQDGTEKQEAPEDPLSKGLRDLLER